MKINNTIKAVAFCLVPAAMLLAGCASQKDYDVSILQLPQPVRDTLAERSPHSQVAEIEKTTYHGQVVYDIVFAHPNFQPMLCIADDGTVVNDKD
jgi:hypothetical protein